MNKEGTCKPKNLEEIKIMVAILENYHDDEKLEKLQELYGKEKYNSAMYVCVFNHYITGKIKAIKTITGDIFFSITGSTKVSSFGELFIKNHS